MTKILPGRGHAPVSSPASAPTMVVRRCESGLSWHPFTRALLLVPGEIRETLDASIRAQTTRAQLDAHSRLRPSGRLRAGGTAPPGHMGLGPGDAALLPRGFVRGECPKKGEVAPSGLLDTGKLIGHPFPENEARVHACGETATFIPARDSSQFRGGQAFAGRELFGRR